MHRSPSAQSSQTGSHRSGIEILFLVLVGLGTGLTGWSLTESIIRTVAGTGQAGFSGDGGPAIEARLNNPAAVAIGGSGVLYIADVRNQRIRRVGPDGLISTVAGNGTAGFAGDGELAVDAQLNQPLGVAVDLGGNLYLADTLNHRIRKIDREGKISTVAGTGQAGFGGDGGPAIEAKLFRPVGLIVDGLGVLYIADVFNHRIRKVDADGGISTIAGDGTAGFGGDGGPATEAQLSRPRDVAIDEYGHLYIADTDNNRIRQVNGNGVIWTVAGNGAPEFSGDGGPAIEAGLNFPRSVATDSLGRLFISDMINNRIRRVDPEGRISTVIGNGGAAFSGDGGPATEASLSLPRGVRVDDSGAIYVADKENNRIRVAR